MPHVPVAAGQEKTMPYFRIHDDFSEDPVVSGFIKSFESRCRQSPGTMLAALNQLGTAATADTVSLRDLRQTGRPELPGALDGTMSESAIITAYFTYRFSETHEFDDKTEAALKADSRFASLLRTHIRMHNETRQSPPKGKTRPAESSTALDARDAVRRYRLAGFLATMTQHQNG